MNPIRIISRLDIKGPHVVKGIHNEGLRVVGEPVDLAKRYYQEGADEIFFMDIVASLYQRNLDFDLLRRVAEVIFVPLTVGGGIRSINDINNALRAGADKVAINTFAIKHPEFIPEAVRKFGSQCIVLSVEAKKRGTGWEAYIDGGRERTGLDAVEWIKKVIDLGAGEILLTSIDREGTKRGFEEDLISEVVSFSRVPVIVHGGAGPMDSVEKIIKKQPLEGVCVSSSFHYRDYSVAALKDFLKKRGIAVRLEKRKSPVKKNK